MKLHKIALEMAGQRFAGLAPTRLPMMYDLATKALNGAVEQTVNTDNKPFRIVNYRVVPNAEDTAIEVAQVIDEETGQYVKLLRSCKEEGAAKLEIGRIVATEQTVQGSPQIRHF
jgi:hypothetical protein